jgi:hypothetical protein
VYTPLVEYPPIEPVEPPIAAVPAPETIAMAPATTLPPLPTPTPAPAPVAVPEPPPSDEVQMVLLLVDLQRYATMSQDDVKREVGNATQTLSRQRTDANRIRLAVLYTLARSSPQDDQRALQLLENVQKGPPNSGAVYKTLAAVLSVQVSERVRAVREEQLKSDAALQKLEALRAMERSLMRERSRNAGGGGGGGGSAGGSGGGGGGGGSGGR